jgi:hypothetical protein
MVGEQWQATALGGPNESIGEIFQEAPRSRGKPRVLDVDEDLKRGGQVASLVSLVRAMAQKNIRVNFEGSVELCAP